jgi:hypothetical protein
LPALRLIARGFRYHIGFAELILINSGTSLLSSFIPVPGGIGVVEFSLEVGPPSAGMTASAAAATIRLYRFATFYLPPLWLLRVSLAPAERLSLGQPEKPETASPISFAPMRRKSTAMITAL